VKNVLGRQMKETEIVIQGFGNVGRWTAYFLRQMGAKIIAVSDVGGNIYNKKGLDIEKLLDYCPTSGDTVKGFQGGETVRAEEFLSIQNDVFIPAALESVITGETAPKMKTKMVVEGANDPTTAEGEKSLLDKGVSVLPDFFANSGGVIASYVEWRDAKSGNQTSEKEVFEMIDGKIEQTFFSGVKAKKELKCASLREAFASLALNALIEAMKARLWI